MLKKFLKIYSFKFRIIFVFSLATLLLVGAFTIAGYFLVKQLYVDQLTEQVDASTQIISNQLDKRYLNAMQLGPPTMMMKEYLQTVLERNMDERTFLEIFIFDKDFNLIAHSDTALNTPGIDPKLFLNKKEIFELEAGGFNSSMPFKGNDGSWYLWGFKKLNNAAWLAARVSAAKLTNIENLAVVFLLIGFGGILITIVLSFIVANSITKPVNKLVDFSREIGKGNFDASLPKNIKGELGFLSDTLEKMKKDIIEKSKEKENLLAQIAHEIRNPLGGIELLANLLKEDFLSEGTDTSYIDKILSEVYRLKNYITAFLDYSRPVSPKAEWVDIENLLEEIKKIFQKQIESRNISLLFDIKLKKIWFDNEHLKQVLINLIANSLDSVSDSGEIIVLSKLNKNFWELSVHDNGEGISTEVFDKIFDPFLTTKKGGTGLGLTISKKLCSENKAVLSASNNMKGAVFTITKEIIHEA
jgi:signal transduction histidine kinase